MGQNRDPSILKIPSSPFPGFWCQWVPTENKKNLQWDKGEKFYNYDDWLKFLISHFFNKWGYSLNGFVKWKGESRGDNGVLKLVNNKLIILEGQERVSFLEEEKIKAKIKKEKKEFERAIPKSTIKKTNTKKTPRI